MSRSLPYPRAGCCLVPLKTRWALLENNYAVRDSGTRVLLFDDAFTAQALQLLADVPELAAAIYMGNGHCPDWARSCLSPDDFLGLFG